MTDEQKLTLAQLLSKIDEGWQTFNAYIDSITPEQLTEPTDAAGWTAKDHMAHLFTWEDSLMPLLERQSRSDYFKMDKALWDVYDWDKVNAIFHKRHQDMPLAEVRQRHQEIHQRVIAKIQTLSDADLYRPYYDFQPGSERDFPIIKLLIDDTYQHYDEHSDYIARIVGKPRT